jgi:hypothetical protein
MSHRKLTTLACAAGLLAFAAPAQAAAPGNDNFEQAIPLGAPGQATGTLDEATREEGEPIHGQQTVWYSFRPSTSQRVALDVPDSTGAVVTVYIGVSVSALRRVATTGDDYPLRAPFDAAIALGGASGG